MVTRTRSQACTPAWTSARIIEPRRAEWRFSREPVIELNRLKPVAFVLCLIPAAVLAWDFWGVTHSRPEA